jgi:hypothetical protein
LLLSFGETKERREKKQKKGGRKRREKSQERKPQPCGIFPAKAGKYHQQKPFVFS